MFVCVTLCMNFQVNKSSSDFWNNLKVAWQQCADLPEKCCVLSVAELDGKVYASGAVGTGCLLPFVYDSNKDQWSTLPDLPYGYLNLVTVTEKKQLLAIGGAINNNGVVEFSNKVFLWDEMYRKWLTPYPNMPTARCICSSISHGLAVIVAGGITCQDPDTTTRSVEVLHINDNNLHDSYWSVVEQLPHVVCQGIPLIVNDKLYITQGADTLDSSTTCNVVTASLPELLQSSNNNTSSSQVWSKLPDMPYSSHSINHYQGHLITFTAGHKVERPDEDKPVWELVPLIHIYNPVTKTWDCVGDIPIGYLLGISVHIRENKILFIGGVTGTHDANKDDDIMTTCSILTLTPQ